MKQKVYISYHVNPAVIKNGLSMLSKDQFIIHARYIKTCAFRAEYGNRQRMYISLYQWCRWYYVNKY